MAHRRRGPEAVCPNGQLRNIAIVNSFAGRTDVGRFLNWASKDSENCCRMKTRSSASLT